MRKSTIKSANNTQKVSLCGSSDVVLAWEDEEDLDRFHQACCDELMPDGTLEQAEVSEIVRLHWMKRRLNIGCQQAYHRHPDATALAAARQQGPDGVRTFLQTVADNMGRDCDRVRTVATSHFQALRKLSDLITAMVVTASTGDDATPVDREIIRDLMQLAERLNGLGNSTIIPALDQLEQGVYERASRPDLIERNAKANAELDRQIDKHHARLVNLKEYKRIYATKSLPRADDYALPAARRIMDNNHD